MSNTSDGSRVSRFGALFFPLMALGGSLAAALIIANDMHGPTLAYAPFEPDAIQDVEFVSQPAARDEALREALVRACGVTGCQAETLHPMIMASVARMTEDELRAGLDAQARVQAESLALRNRSLPGTESARMAEMELLAGERIAALYELELDRR